MSTTPSLRWSSWQPIDQETGYSGPAVYRVRLVVSSRPVAIPRFLATDMDGILSIGECSDLDRRRQQFVSGLNENSGHSSGNLLYILERFTRLRKTHPDRMYEFSFGHTETKDEAKACQDQLLKRYIVRFGEAPPLNSAVPDRKEPLLWATQNERE